MQWGMRGNALVAGLSLAMMGGLAKAEERLPPPRFAQPGTLVLPDATIIPAFSTEVRRAPLRVETKTTPSSTQPQASWPKTLDEAKAEAKAKLDPKPDLWPAGAIAAARARCAAVLKEIDAVAIAEPPMKRGSCGAPAPVRLMSIGRNPAIELSPPALVTCDMALALHQWITSDLQPLARKHLGAPVAKIEVMSDYSCRNAYGRARTRLSEHGRANALDIRAFVTAKAETAAVLEDWGPTERDVRAQITAANTAAARTATAATASAGAASEPVAALRDARGVSTAAISRGTIADGLVGRAGTINSAGQAERQPATGFSLGEASRLGGPKVSALSPLAAIPGASVTPPTSKARFLREAHTSACGIFGTVLGPEANNAHRNHLHLDAAQRGSGSFCQ